MSFTQTSKRFVLILRYNGTNSFLLINATKIYHFKAENSEIKDYTLCLGNISTDFTINNMKKRNKEELQNFFLLILILFILKIF